MEVLLLNLDIHMFQEEEMSQLVASNHQLLLSGLPDIHKSQLVKQPWSLLPMVMVQQLEDLSQLVSMLTHYKPILLVS